MSCKTKSIQDVATTIPYEIRLPCASTVLWFRWRYSIISRLSHLQSMTGEGCPSSAMILMLLGRVQGSEAGKHSLQMALLQRCKDRRSKLRAHYYNQQLVHSLRRVSTACRIHRVAVYISITGQLLLILCILSPY